MSGTLNILIPLGRAKPMEIFSNPLIQRADYESNTDKEGGDHRLLKLAFLK